MAINYYLKKSNQSCHLLPWTAEAACPWPPGYVRILLPLPQGQMNRDGSVANIQVVRATTLARRVDNKELPSGQWVR